MKSSTKLALEAIRKAQWAARQLAHVLEAEIARRDAMRKKKALSRIGGKQ